VLLLVPSVCFGDWTGEDSAREAVYLGFHVMDWGQTLDIADHPDRWHENNPLLGSHPSRGRVNRHFVLTALLHPVVSYLLPRPYREVWQYSTIGLQVVVVGNNARLGIGFGF
jgi:hypothetical protein